MAPLRMTKDYVAWHYSVAYRDMFHLWQNYAWFTNNLFSVKQLFLTWFAPLKRMHEDSVSLFTHPGEFFGNMMVNLLMRIVGFVVRTMFLVVACAFFVVLSLVAITFFLFWTILPFLVLSLFLYGLILLLS